MAHRARSNMIRNAVLFALFAGPALAFAQTKSQSMFRSAADEELSIKTVVVAPFTDNVSGIYAKPLDAEIRKRLGNDPQWILAPFPPAAMKGSFSDRPAEVKKVLQDAKADALLTGRLMKGPGGVTLYLALYVGPSGQPLILEEVNEPKRFDIERLQEVLAETMTNLRAKIPYQGVLLSRRGQQVTLNVGRRGGLENGREFSVIQILKVGRHPKKGILIGTEREILGKAKVFKADDELSFANILSEKEPGLLVPGMKVLLDTMVRYPEPITTPEGQVVDDLANRADKDIAFGEKPIAWLPEPDPQFGRVQVLAGIGQYNQSANFQTAGGISGSSSLTPNLGLMGELWINAQWFLGFDLRQSAFTIDNTLAGSTPGKLNMSLSRYSVSGGRTFLLSPDFFGPKIQLNLGFGKFSARVDESTPVLFSNMEFGGMHLGFLFSTSLGDNSPWDIGARLRYHWNPGVSEGVTSGSTDSVSVSDFGFLLGKRIRPNFRYVGEFNMEYYNADFSNGGARPDPVSSIGHRVTTLLVGLEYSF